MEVTALFWRRKREERGGIITGDELERRLAAADPPLVLDVRERWEWNQGHMPGALHIPLGTLPERVGRLPKDRDIVAICRSGQRSAQAAAWLTQQGFRVQNLRGGYLKWRAPMDGRIDKLRV